MKYVKVIAIASAISAVFFAYNAIDVLRTDGFGFKKTEFTIVEEKDTHGGFHGDGTYNLILDCSGNSNRAHEIIKNWEKLPLSDNLESVIYGNFTKEINWPTIRNGVYKFIDRHSESTNKSDDTDLLSRHSFNFSIAVYDLDTNTLYYFEMDT